MTNRVINRKFLQLYYKAYRDYASKVLIYDRGNKTGR